MTRSPRVLVVEDEPAIADTLIYALRTDGFRPEWVTTSAAALSTVQREPFDCLILDVGLPDGSGFELCKRIRQSSAVPVLFLTARNAEIDRVVGLEIGGDDYVVKPFSPREVTARVKAILRRSQTLPSSGHGASTATTANQEPSDDFVVEEEYCRISYRGTRLDLARYEYRLLRTLIARPGRVFTRDQLMEAGWEDPGASLDRTVDAHIKTIRAKLRTIAPDADPIQTHRGLGYSLRISA